MDVKLQRVLVTGLEGFTGFYMQKELETAGFETYGLDQVNLLDSKALRARVAEVRPHKLIHLAAIASVEANDMDMLYRVNLVGTRNLLELIFLEAPDIQTLLLASSANIYGNAQTDKPLDEKTPPQPTNDYAVSKLAMEYIARLWFDRLPILITRPFNYTGVRQKETLLLPKIVRHFREGKKQIELGNLDVSRDFSDVRDLVNAYRRLIEVPSIPSGETVNICSGIQYSLREILSLMEEISGYSIEAKSNPEFVRAREVQSLLGSNALLQKFIGPWKSRPLHETLKWMYDCS